MLKDVTFGQYYPSNSFVHKMDARIKLVLCLLYMVGIFFVTSFVEFAFITVFLFALIGFSRVPIRSVFKSVKGIIFLLLFTVILNVFFNKEGNVLVEWKFIVITDGGLIASCLLSGGVQRINAYYDPRRPYSCDRKPA